MTAASKIPAGARLTAALLQGVAPSGPGVKGTDQSYTNTTLANDSALFVPVVANAGYLVLCYLDYQGGTQGSSDLKMQWTGPSGATLALNALYYPTSGGVGGNTNISQTIGLSTVLAAGTDGGVPLGLLWFGTLTTSSTPGTLQLQAAQNTSSGTATVIHAGSGLAAWELQ